MSEVPKNEINDLAFFKFGSGHVTPSLHKYAWRGSWNERISVCTIQMKTVLANVPNK